MLTNAPPRLSSDAFSLQPSLAMVRRQSESRPEVSQIDPLRIDVGTFVAGDSLVIDSISEERLYQLPAAMITFLRRSSFRGYCPPIPALRRLGFRTRREVEQQKLAVCWRW